MAAPEFTDYNADVNEIKRLMKQALESGYPAELRVSVPDRMSSVFGYRYRLDKEGHTMLEFQGRWKEESNPDYKVVSLTLRPDGSWMVSGRTDEEIHPNDHLVLGLDAIAGATQDPAHRRLIDLNGQGLVLDINWNTQSKTS